VEVESRRDGSVEAVLCRRECWVGTEISVPRRTSPPKTRPSSTTTTPMASPIPSAGALRVLRSSINPKPHCHTQIRHASLLRRPKRPYTFTQLVTLSDGSSFVHRTTSPIPVYKSTKDVRNTPLWNPSSQKLLNIEEDEAGRLKAFRAKFGRGWDAEVPDEVCGHGHI
jgi:hypothetical protein